MWSSTNRGVGRGDLGVLVRDGLPEGQEMACSNSTEASGQRELPVQRPWGQWKEFDLFRQEQEGECD